jgi:hypothetical protein
MLVRHLGHWLCILGITSTTAGVVASCGSGGGNSDFPNVSTDASMGDGSVGMNEGGSFFNDSGTGGCKPKTCQDLGYTCGENSDGCGNLLQCGTCTAPEFCGGGGFSKCGGNTQLTPDGAPACTPTTCATLGYTCGVAGDGCGGSVNCGNCSQPQYCGGGGFSKCGGNDGLTPDGGNPCTPTTCAALGFNCGYAGDGCGGSLMCGTCTAPQSCGGGGFNLCGGNNGMSPDGGSLCTPTTCAALGYSCGYAGDGCGGQLNCGNCTSPAYCGGNGFNQCGGNNGLMPDGAPNCTPATCGSLGYNCGAAGDGCGGQLNCGTCNNPQYCGGGGFDVCGGNNGLQPDGGVPCTPTTCSAQHYTCGFAGDGCGGQLNCGTCTNPQYCGGGGYDVCGGNNGLTPDGSVTCTPTTCAALGFNCGEADDGCGHLLSCGTCTAPQFCGGGGSNVCGPTTIASCDSGSTTLTGYVFDPGNHLPVYNALVYVPQGAVQTPQTGVVPAACGCSPPPAYASAYTGIDGKFTLNSPPAGANVTVVVQLGKWQRVFSEPITACAANNLGGGTALAAQNLTLPSKHSQGNIPLFAVDTGAVDTLECVLLKMGIDPGEFVDPAITGGKPTATGRIHMYQGSIYDGGAIIDSNTPTEAALTESSSVMDSYDVLLFPCQGGPGTYNTANGFPNTLTNLINYTAVGGRAFTTHYHYDLLRGNGSFNGTANWVNDKNDDNGPDPGYIDTSFARGLTLAQWLNQSIVYGGTYGQIPVSVVREDFTSVNAPAQRWMYLQSPNPASYPVHYTFDTPFGATQTCGRVVYSDFHVENSGGAYNDPFPTECSGGSLTPQEKLLEFMLFDLTSCVGPATCQPKTCANYPAGTCGQQSDGCGGVTADCGNCVAPQTCGGGGTPSMCGYPDGGACGSKTCQQQNITCGPAGDGCGNVLQCGTCSPPLTCGGGGVSGQCGYPDGGACVPKSCQQQNLDCGPTGDGCGNALDCGMCVAPMTCGGGGTPGQCGYPEAGACTPKSCAEQGIGCGPAGDGCGGPLDCGMCVAPMTCGGGGTPSQCGGSDGAVCMTETCSQQHITCGPAGDGCGGALNCGNCTLPQTCGGGGVAGQCGAPDAGACKPESCAQQNIACGPAGDGCGNMLDCGTCVAPQTCGGGGTPGQCGLLDGGPCVPQTCSSQNIACGPAGDGCGNLLQCGSCAAPQTCGGGGTAGQCGGGSQ